VRGLGHYAKRCGWVLFPLVDARVQNPGPLSFFANQERLFAGRAPWRSGKPLASVRRGFWGAPRPFSAKSAPSFALARHKPLVRENSAVGGLGGRSLSVSFGPVPAVCFRPCQPLADVSAGPESRSPSQATWPELALQTFQLLVRPFPTLLEAKGPDRLKRFRSNEEDPRCVPLGKNPLSIRRPPFALP